MRRVARRLAAVMQDAMAPPKLRIKAASRLVDMLDCPPRSTTESK
jgi:hypothetical protein